MESSQNSDFGRSASITSHKMMFGRYDISQNPNISFTRTILQLVSVVKDQVCMVMTLIVIYNKSFYSDEFLATYSS